MSLSRCASRIEVTNNKSHTNINILPSSEWVAQQPVLYSDQIYLSSNIVTVSNPYPPMPEPGGPWRRQLQIITDLVDW